MEILDHIFVDHPKFKEYYLCKNCFIIIYKLSNNYYISSSLNKGYENIPSLPVNISCDGFIIKSIIE